MTPHLTDWGQYCPTSLMEQRPITYALRTLCPAERNHAQLDKGELRLYLASTSSISIFTDRNSRRLQATSRFKVCLRDKTVPTKIMAEPGLTGIQACFNQPGFSGFQTTITSFTICAKRMVNYGIPGKPCYPSFSEWPGKSGLNQALDLPQVGLLRKSNQALEVLLHQEFQGGFYLWQPTTRSGFTERVKITATPMALISYLCRITKRRSLGKQNS